MTIINNTYIAPGYLNSITYHKITATTTFALLLYYIISAFFLIEIIQVVQMKSLTASTH